VNPNRHAHYQRKPEENSCQLEFAFFSRFREKLGTVETRRTAGAESSGLSPLSLVRIIEKAMQLFGIAGPRKHPIQALSGAAGMNRDRDSLPLLQWQRMGQFEGAVFVDGLDL
jgi:hypothetical protein